MAVLVGYLLLFLVVAVGFVFVHLVIGRFIRPVKPGAEKLTIYECGEPTIGSAWIQFDLRFYVVALLFVIFDVEVAFFFPWAVVFGQANTLASKDVEWANANRGTYNQMVKNLEPPATFLPESKQALEVYNQEEPPLTPKEVADNAEAAKELAWIAFYDILVFFGVLLVGFAYLWKRGDLAWVRSTAAERGLTGTATAPAPAAEPGEQVLVGAGRE
jgi:NADH-quinone oxidoreductase subunit A